MKSRVWRPSPYTTSGRSSRTEVTKRETTLCLCPLCGPYTLEKRSTAVGSPKEVANAAHRASPASLPAPYGERGWGTTASLAGGLAAPRGAFDDGNTKQPAS